MTVQVDLGPAAPRPLQLFPQGKSYARGVVETPSVFDRRSLTEIENEIRSVYLGDSRPWVIGFSGGKDSTAVLQLVWHSLVDLPRDQMKPIYVIASDTRVEAPAIVERIDTALAAMNQAARDVGLPISAHKVMPAVEDGFWVNLIGKGYPAPNRRFRWCTDRLKINPANRFILDRVAEHSEVVVVLGVRASESATRAQAMSLHRREGTRLARHSQLPNAYVYPPIEDWNTDDVWTYLLQVPSPWGQNNRDLLALYSSAQSGECPLVIDKTTPSCGNSRFGCWVCTVVERDRSMEAMIDAGDEWLEPLLEFRDLLSSTQDPDRKLEFRDIQRRDGLVKRTTDGRLSPGPYKLAFCKELLQRLLEVQLRLQAEGPDPTAEIISPGELHEIRRIWRVERQDWDDSVPTIYRQVTGKDLDWVVDAVGQFTAQDRQLLDEACDRHGVPSLLVAKLLDIERDLAGLGRRSSIFARLDSVLGHEWRSADELDGTDGEPGKEPEWSPEPLFDLGRM